MGHFSCSNQSQEENFTLHFLLQQSITSGKIYTTLRGTSTTQSRNKHFVKPDLYNLPNKWFLITRILRGWFEMLSSQLSQHNSLSKLHHRYHLKKIRGWEEKCTPLTFSLQMFHQLSQS
jgi:hypothetical protein